MSVGAPARFFSQSLPVCRVLVSAGIGNIPAGLGGAARKYLAFIRVRCNSRRCSCASSPRAWARSRRSRRALRLVSYVPSSSLRGMEGEVSATPSSGSRITNSSLSCYRVIQVDAHAPFEKGRLVVWRLVHESAYVGLLGRARSRSLGTDGAEALCRWDPLTSCPRWLLNTTYGAPSS
jgi:hypothetical protein